MKSITYNGTENRIQFFAGLKIKEKGKIKHFLRFLSVKSEALNLQNILKFIFSRCSKNGTLNDSCFRLQ